MRWKRSLEHLERRIDRYYRLAAAAKLPDIRQRYIELARRYRVLWVEALTFGNLDQRALRPSLT